MTEYIERKRAIADACNALELYPSEYAELEDALNRIPAADVAPVRHGRWEVGYFHDRVCSCCLHPDNDFDDYAHKFCPHCGARMDDMEV